MAPRPSARGAFAGQVGAPSTPALQQPEPTRLQLQLTVPPHRLARTVWSTWPAWLAVDLANTATGVTVRLSDVRTFLQSEGVKRLVVQVCRPRQVSAAPLCVCVCVFLRGCVCAPPVSPRRVLDGSVCCRVLCLHLWRAVLLVHRECGSV